MRNLNHCSRREFLIASVGALAGAALPALAESSGAVIEPVIDIHQHTNYAGRTDEELIRHQQVMGVTKTVLLPAGRFYGLDALCGTNDTVLNLAHKRRGEFVFFANEVADIEEAPAVIRKYLRRGAIGIGEQKFRVQCDGRWFERIAKVAEEFGVPVLMHFQHGVYNPGIENFHKTLERFPKVNFIGHAQTWWGNVDAKLDQPDLYPKTKVTPGGITDRLLRDYPNMFGDHSAGSGLNFFTRDPEHAAAFIERHQNKLMFGSDCDDRVGSGPNCQGAQILVWIRKLAPNKAAERKILYENARKLLKL
jgi:predicted TIM-barrel fold metal-dependent hydrolase